MSIEKINLVTRLRALAQEMLALSDEMLYYGGFSEIAQHGNELARAAAIARSWD